MMKMMLIKKVMRMEWKKVNVKAIMKDMKKALKKNGKVLAI